MVNSKKSLYSPSLRLKAGELIGLQRLAPSIADRIRPRLIVPPPSERDEITQSRLFTDRAIPDISSPLSSCWPTREALIDPTYLFQEFGRDESDVWLPKMFERARAAGAQAIPLIAAQDLIVGNRAAFRKCIDREALLQFGLVLSSAELGDRELTQSALDCLDQLGLSAGNCLAIADFYDADLSQPHLVAPIISSSLTKLQSLAQWQQVVFQGTHFPEKNPAEPSSYSIVPRNEWHAWRQAVHFEPETADQMIFGDYAADCAKMSFSGSGGAAIRHYRYAMQDAWLVQRGADEGRHRTVMRKVSSEILNSVHFAGRAFSWGDDYIFKTANDAGGPGSPKDWRAVNTNHHITRVVTDIAALLGIKFEQKIPEPLAEQMSLLHS